MSGKLLETVKNGVLTGNPTFRLVLGLCPAIAVTTTVANGLGMGISTTFVLVCSNLFVSLLRNFIPPRIRIPAFVIIIASFVTILQMLLKAFLPALDKSLGIFIPLIVVNCIIFARAESFASKNPPFLSVIDGLSMGVGFTLAMFVLSAVRELIGSGSFYGIEAFGSGFEPAMIFALAPGGFLALGIILAIFNKITGQKG